jgi:RNA polymerase sigma-70 factor (ECF subfamily)
MGNKGESLPASLADLANLGRLFAEHQARLLAVIQRRMDPKLRPRIDPEDILHESFLRARGRWEDFKRRRGLPPFIWLYGIVCDYLIDVWRQNKRLCRDLDREVLFPEHSSLQMGLGLVDTGTKPSEAMARDELVQRMRQALDLLPAADKKILMLRHYDEMSFEEVAAVLSLAEGKPVSVNAAAVRFVRALRRLRDLWHDVENMG